jgi:DNA-binding transcriptional MocR family regulator
MDFKFETITVPIQIDGHTIDLYWPIDRHRTRMLTRTASQSLTSQLANRFAERIHNRLLAPGARLPSVRECARQQGVSPYTVVAAYDQLLAQGLVEARKQKGFYVRDAAASRGGALPARPAPEPIVVADASTLIRGMFYRPSDKPQPGMGVFPPDWLEAAFLHAAVRRVTGAKSLQAFSLQYGEPAGDGELRRSLADRLARIRIPVDPAQILTTIGATHALDIISRTLLRPGDPVMVEEPGWALEFARHEALGMRILPVPRGADGPDLDVMER